MNLTTKTAAQPSPRQSWAARITSGLVIGAFANSYQHGVRWASIHSPQDQLDFWAWTIAALPELIIIMVVLRFPENRWTWRTWAPGALAVGWTLYANGSAAYGPHNAWPGLSDMFISLAPGLVSILLFAAAQNAPAQPIEAAQPSQEPAQKRPSTKRAPAQKAAQPQPNHGEALIPPAQIARLAPAQKVADTAQLRPHARGVVWATERLGRGETVTQGDLENKAEGYPGLSRSTAQRVMKTLADEATENEKESESA